MKRIQLSITAFAALCCIHTFGQFTMGQSTKVLSEQIIEKYKPILLNTNTISGELQSSNSGKYHYYSFVAGRGEVIITVNLESTTDLNGLKIELFDNSELPLGFDMAMSLPSKPFQKATKIYIPSRQPVLFRITEGVNSGLGKYKTKSVGL